MDYVSVLYIIVWGIAQTLGDIPPAWVAVIGTVAGGIVLKLVETYFNRNANKGKNKLDEASSYRDQIKQLTDTHNHCQTRLDEVEKEVTFWRNRFYEEQEDNATLRVLMIQNGVTPPTKRVVPPDTGQ